MTYMYMYKENIAPLIKVKCKHRMEEILNTYW